LTFRLGLRALFLLAVGAGFASASYAQDNVSGVDFGA